MIRISSAGKGCASLVAALMLRLVAGCSQSGIRAGEGYVSVHGGRVWYRIVGSARGTPLVLLHGGPGGTSRGLHPLEALADERPVIFYDQLGCGRSDRPNDNSLWWVERFVEELQTLRDALGLKRVHILGHSWGSMLAVDYMLTRPEGVRSLILAGPAISIPRYLEGVKALRAQLPQNIQNILARHEEAGTTDSKEYQDAAMVFYRRHLCRLDPWPPEMSMTDSNFGTEVYNVMWGPSEFFATGPLKDYDRTSQLGALRLPVLFTAGRYDETTPEQAEWYRSLVPNARLAIFEKSGHMTMLDESDRYVQVVREFLRDVER